MSNRELQWKPCATGFAIAFDHYYIVARPNTWTVYCGSALVAEGAAQNVRRAKLQALQCIRDYVRKQGDRLDVLLGALE